MQATSHTTAMPARLAARLGKPVRSGRCAALPASRRALSVSASSVAQLAAFNKPGSVSVVEGNGGLPKVCLSGTIELQ